MTELDVIILGGYYGDGKRSGLVSSFLLGVAESLNSGDESPSQFYTFAKVASGFTVDELNKLLQKLKLHWQPNNPEQIVWKKEKPDLWIDPKNSIILQVKASELIKTSDFPTEYTLRFPRVEKIRYDKPWYNCLNLSTLKELTKGNKAVEKLTNRHIKENDLEMSPPKRSRKSNSSTILSSLYHLNDVEQSSTLLEGKEFCVLSGNEKCSKEDVEVEIKKHSGRVVQFAGPNTMCSLVGHVSPTINILMESSKNDVVKIDWILKVFSKSKLLELNPDDMIVTTEKTKLSFTNRFDKYGDSLTKPATKESLQNVLENITEQVGDYLTLMPCEFVSFDEEIKFNNPLGIFRSCYAYFCQQSNNILLAHEFVFYGGTKCDQIENYSTHVIVVNSMNEWEKITVANNTNVKIVHENWLKECLQLGKIIPEQSFQITNLL